LENPAGLALQPFHNVLQPVLQAGGKLSICLVERNLPHGVERVGNVDRDPDKLRQFTVPDEAEPGAVHDQSVLPVDVESLISDKTLLASKLLMLSCRHLGIVRQDERLDLDRLAV